MKELPSRTRAEWFGTIRGDILAGLVVALALIPEAIAFSIIAGVDPKVGLYASFSIAVLIAIVGQSIINIKSGGGPAVMRPRRRLSTLHDPGAWRSRQSWQLTPLAVDFRAELALAHIC